MVDKTADLVYVTRGLANDTAIYKSPRGIIIVSVSFGLLAPFCTTVFVDGIHVATFDDNVYKPFHEILARLGYKVTGIVDFTTVTEPEEYNEY